jgi:hypothetical protein
MTQSNNYLFIRNGLPCFIERNSVPFYPQDVFYPGDESGMYYNVRCRVLSIVNRHNYQEVEFEVLLPES